MPEKRFPCPSDPHYLDYLSGEWVPAMKESYFIGRQAKAEPGETVEVVFDFPENMAEFGFQARRLVCAERPEDGKFMICSQTVGGRLQRAFSREEIEAVVFLPATIPPIPFRLHFCKPGEKITVRVRNDGQVKGEINVGIIGDFYRKAA